jgi:hypothetical protein
MQHFGIALPLYVSTVQAVNENAHAMPMLTDGRQKFVVTTRNKINGLPMSAQNKQDIYRFVMGADDKLAKLLKAKTCQWR